METQLRTYRTFVQGVIYTSLCELIRFVKISFIIGSKALSFSATQCVSPLVGYYAGARAAWAVFALRTGISMFIGIAGHLLLALPIPTLCASLYSATCTRSDKPFARIAMALLIISCMVLFAAHPVGKDAMLYTFAWPVAIIGALRPFRSLFLQALATTYTAHAVGSVIWLYTVGPHSPQAWLALIPIATTERILFACGMTAIIIICPLVQAWVRRIIERVKRSFDTPTVHLEYSLKLRERECIERCVGTQDEPLIEHHCRKTVR